MGCFDKNPLISAEWAITRVEMGARGAPMNHGYIPTPMVIHARKRLPEERPFRKIEAGDC